MNAVFKYPGDAIDYTPGSDMAAGSVVVQGELVGVTKLDIKANALGSLHVVGVFDFAKATGTGTAIGAGAKVYWNATAKVATEDAASGANKYLGKTVAAAGDGAELVRVRLSQ